MSRESDPQAITDALAAAIDAFNEEGYGVPMREDAIDSDADWKTQLTKACRLLAAVETISEQGFYRRNRPSDSGLDPEGEGRKLR